MCLIRIVISALGAQSVQHSSFSPGSLNHLTHGTKKGSFVQMYSPGTNKDSLAYSNRRVAADSAGYKMHPEYLHNVSLNQDTHFSFMELHIEQGPILRKEGWIFLVELVSVGFKIILTHVLFCRTVVPIVIVTAISAPASIKVEFEGNDGHAGAVLMPTRLAFPSIFWHCNWHCSVTVPLPFFSS